MNAKIPLRKFAETLSVKSGISTTEAESFIKLVFGIASDELRTGSTVRIKGLGAFSLSRGEADPVNFEPDKNFATAINSPFAIFAPVELAEGVTDEILSDIDRSIENDAVAQEAPENDIEIATADVASMPVEETENEDVQTVPETDVCDEAVTDEECAPADMSDVETVITDENGEKNTDAEQPDTEPVSETENDKPGDAAAEVEEFPEPEETEMAPESAAPDWEYEEEEYVQQPERNESRFGAGFVAGLIVGLAIGALALCAYVMYYVNSSPENQSVETELIETAPEPIA